MAEVHPAQIVVGAMRAAPTPEPSRASGERGDARDLRDRGRPQHRDQHRPSRDEDPHLLLPADEDKGNPAMKHESTKRIPSQGESAAIALSGKKQARCGFCQGMGHNRRTCPMRRQQEEEAKAMEE